ncbi:hypothetical protein [Burkholderia ambifaria]|uniref:Uncharacterized protein n=1 Tax=Burkholderia ambifaria TaxID=152480 RepID=A0AA41JJQ4_9BURK|nr:hypothetical protein [Burkholderia ambifaria]MBR8129819.1 hypothetical protein [Burkholderia ambifaria]
MMRLALRKRFACPACQSARSEGWSDSHWQGSRNYMGVFKSSVKNAGVMRENTEKLAGWWVAMGRNLAGMATFAAGAIGLRFWVDLWVEGLLAGLRCEFRVRRVRSFGFIGSDASKSID